MKAVRRWTIRAIVLGLMIVGGLRLYGYARGHPEDLPWTKLDLAQPIGAFTGAKLAALGEDGEGCLTLMRAAGVRFDSLPPRASGQCGWSHALRVRRFGALGISWRPDGLGTACPVAAGLALWEWHVIQPAALEHFGTQVAAIEHFGSYSCRRIYGQASAPWSEHARANAVDVGGFVLADGRRIRVLADWRGDGPEANFLREVRDGACDLFSTVLSPDYNAAHRDHLHLDQANRGAFGWRGCR